MHNPKAHRVATFASRAVDVAIVAGIAYAPSWEMAVQCAAIGCLGKFVGGLLLHEIRVMWRR